MTRTRLDLNELRVDSFEPLPAGAHQLINSCTGSPAVCTKCCVEPTCTDCPDC